MPNMPEIESAQSKIKDRETGSQEAQDRLNYCAFEALEKNAFGKELMNSLKMRLYAVIGQNQPNLYYIEGQNDMIRMLLGMIEEHKLTNSGETK